MKLIATIRDDMIVGRGTGIFGVEVPEHLEELSLSQLRWNGSSIIDAATITQWHIDGEGAKRLNEGPGRQEITCAWDATLANSSGTWVVVDTVKADLKSYAASKRAAVINGGCTVTVSGTPLKVWADTQTQTALTALSVHASSNPALTTVWKCRDGTFSTLNATGIAALAAGVLTFVQSAFAIEGDVMADIDAGDITTTAEIDAAPWPAN